MLRWKRDTITCERCKFKLARVQEDVNGNPQLKTSSGVHIRVDKVNKIVYPKCPRCGHETPAPGAFWLEF